MASSGQGDRSGPEHPPQGDEDHREGNTLDTGRSWVLPSPPFHRHLPVIQCLQEGQLCRPRSIISRMAYHCAARGRRPCYEHCLDNSARVDIGIYIMLPACLVSEYPVSRYDGLLTSTLASGKNISLGIVIKGAEGIVLSAESRVTLEARPLAGDPIRVNFDNATKLFGQEKDVS